MKNKEIEELLDKLKDKDWYDELDLTGTKWIELKQEETNLLLSYIEQLENNRDKAIKYNKNILKENWYGGYEKEKKKKNIDILKGDSDE